MNTNQILINRLKASLSSIENLKIFEWLSRPLGEGEYPCLIIRDPKDSVKNESIVSLENHTLTVEIDIVTTPDTYEAVEIRELISKVKLAFRDAIEMDDFYNIGRYLGREIIGEHKDYFYVASRLSFEIEFETTRWGE